MTTKILIAHGKTFQRKIKATESFDYGRVFAYIYQPLKSETAFYNAADWKFGFISEF